jgi:hypothetical protein
MTICLHLAANNITPEQQRGIMFWGVILIAAVLVGAVVIMMLRRWLKEPLAGASDDAGFSLSELRAMRDRGEITPEEYEQTRSRVIAKVKAAANAPRLKKEAERSDTTPLGGAFDGSILPPEDTPGFPSDDSANNKNS